MQPLASESELILLTDLTSKIKSTYRDLNKWACFIDEQGGAETFLKYQGSTVYSVDDDDIEPSNLCRDILKVINYGTTVTFNFTEYEYKNIFHPEYFPEDILDPKWILSFSNIDKLRAKFPDVYQKNLVADDEFRFVFLFRKNNVPPILWEKTKVYEVCKPGEYEEKLEAREKAQEEAFLKKQQEEAKKEEAKTNTKPNTSTKPVPNKATATKTVPNKPGMNNSASKTSVGSKAGSSGTKPTVTTMKSVIAPKTGASTGNKSVKK